VLSASTRETCNVSAVPSPRESRDGTRGESHGVTTFRLRRLDRCNSPIWPGAYAEEHKNYGAELEGFDYPYEVYRFQFFSHAVWLLRQHVYVRHEDFIPVPDEQGNPGLRGVSQARTPAARGSSGQPLISLRRRVFAAGLLGVHTFRSALLVLQASDARPGTLEIVAHRDMQRAAALAG
jgi:hypothetical protein